MSSTLATENRFPTKGTCLSIYSRAVNAEAPLEQVLGKAFPWCARWAAELKRLFAAYVEAKQRQNVLDYDDLLLYWAQMLAEPAFAARSARASIMSWSTSIRTRTGCRRRSCWHSSRTGAA